MHKAGMTEILAKELAFQLRDINNHNFGLLFTKAEFNEFENEVSQFKNEVNQNFQNIRT
jgi:hypothetical protein